MLEFVQQKFNQKSERTLKTYYQMLTPLQEICNIVAKDALENTIKTLSKKRGTTSDESLIQVLKEKLYNIFWKGDPQPFGLYFKQQFERLQILSDNIIKTQGLEFYLSKSKAAYFGRAGAGLCTATEDWSWNDKNFLPIRLSHTII